MYEIKKNSRTLEDGTKITTYSREIESCNILEVEAGTTGYRDCELETMIQALKFIVKVLEDESKK